MKLWSVHCLESLQCSLLTTSEFWLHIKCDYVQWKWSDRTDAELSRKCTVAFQESSV